MFLISLINTIHLYTNQNKEDVKNFIKVTKHPSVVRSVTHFETRFKGYEDYSTVYYPNMIPIDYLREAYE